MTEDIAVEQAAAEEPKRHRLHFPTAITVLFIVMLFAAALTYIVPAGKYSKLTYDADQDSFVITKPDDSTELMPPTQQTLDSLGVSGLLILVSVIVCGNMWGIVGILLAIPLAAIIDFVCRDVVMPHLEERRHRLDSEASE